MALHLSSFPSKFLKHKTSYILKIPKSMLCHGFQYIARKKFYTECHKFWFHVEADNYFMNCTLNI